MTKEQFIPICYSYKTSGQCNMQDIYELLCEYMKEIDNSKYKDIESYIPHILKNPLFMVNAKLYIDKAINYFSSKLNTIEAYDKEGRLIAVY